MIGAIYCWFVRMRGGKHDMRRDKDHRVCRNCGHTVPIKRRTKPPTVAEVRELLRETKA